MAYINLLPWREEQRQRQQKAYLAVLGSVAAVTFVAGYLVFAGIGTVIDSQRHRNDFLQQEIRQLDRQIAEIKTLKEKRDALAQRRLRLHVPAFGGGPHICIGAPLARIEARHVYLKLLEKYPNLRLAPQTMNWRTLPFFRGLETLIVEG